MGKANKTFIILKVFEGGDWNALALKKENKNNIEPLGYET